MDSGTNLRDLAERVNSGTNPEDLAERMTSGTNPGDLAEMVNSGTNPGDLAERVNSGTNLGDLAERGLSVFFEQVGMTSSDSSSSVRVISSPGSRGVSLGDPEASPSGASLGPSLPVDARALRDLEVMKADHDLDTIVIEGSLAVIREPYNIPIEYELHVPQLGQRPYSSNAPDMCILVDALEADLRFSLHPLIEECLRWWRISPSQVAPSSWRYLIVFLSECRGAEIILIRDLFMACFRLYKSRGGYYLTARVSFRVSGALSNNKSWKSRYLFVSGLVWGFRFDWSAHPIGNAPPYLSEEEFILVDRLKGILSSLCMIKEMTELWLVKAGLSPASRGIKKVKVLTRRHKSRHDEGGSHSHSKGKEPVAPSEEPETPVESNERDASPVHHRPRSIKDIFKTKVHKDDAWYYALHMFDLGHQDLNKEIKARWGGGLKNSTKVWNESSATEEFERGLLARELYMLPSEVLLAQAAKEMVLQELDALKSGGGPEAVTKAEERASELEKELKKTKRE
ncbi:hypothetical protein B296_00005952 [Ensete ventricosum]|uniref:Uncharacterized protein n=1 Tax=Ensete ventricosum TaxID=4639 RepID=A0A426ZLR3_ENSVE|nr:hypothetical protein B296_00005952 [Ensete ventricosum]